MLTRTLALECPLALSGNEKIRSGAPTQLLEARRAIQAGKLPWQAGMMPLRHDHQYELTLHWRRVMAFTAALRATYQRAIIRTRVHHAWAFWSTQKQ